MRFTSILSTAMAFAPALTYAADWAVSVGANNAFAFSPTEVHPAAGDTITFTFLTRNRKDIFYGVA